MRTIAYVTLLFLPGALIAAIFGMNFFQFDAETHQVLIAKSFWYYWAFTIPITIAVVGFWNVWNFREKRKDVSFEKDVNFSGGSMRVEDVDVGGRIA